MIRVRRIVPALAGIFLALPVVAQQAPSERLRQLFVDDWEFRMRESPTWATSVGDLRYNALLDPVGLADVRRQAGENRALLQRLRAIPATRWRPRTASTTTSSSAARLTRWPTWNWGCT